MRILSLIVLLAISGCEGKSEHESKMAKARAEQNEKNKIADEKARAEAAAKAKAQAEAEAKRLEKQKKLLAARPPGNRATDKDVALNDDELASLSELAKADTFLKVARRMKAKQAKWTPFLIRALSHMSDNVRTQAARVFIVNKVHDETVTNAFIKAVKNEASDVVLENWAYDLRLYKDKAVLPALHGAFKIARTPGARGNLAETLMSFKYEPSRADIRNALLESDHIMERVYLISALKRQPSAADREAISKFVNHENSLLAAKAAECVKVIDAAKEESK